MKHPLVSIPIADIANLFDVRKALNEDRILQLAELYQAEEELPPIIVVSLDDGKYAFVDGRHRTAALALLNRTEVLAIVQPETDRLSLFAQALKANYGGPLPPSQEDLRHTILRLVEAGGKERFIREKLNFIPYKILKRYISDTYGTLKKRRVNEALGLIAEGMSIPDAAKRCKVDEDTLRDSISGKRRKWGSNEEKGLLAENKNYVLTAMKASTIGIGKKIQHLLYQVANGDLRPEIVEQVIATWESRLASTAHRIKDWRERLTAAAETPGGAKEEEGL